MLNKDSINILELLNTSHVLALPDFCCLKSQSGTTNVHTDCFKKKLAKQRKIEVYLNMWVRLKELSTENISKIENCNL